MNKADHYNLKSNKKYTEKQLKDKGLYFAFMFGHRHLFKGNDDTVVYWFDKLDNGKYEFDYRMKLGELE